MDWQARLRSKLTGSSPPQFIIDGRTDSVEEIACDENYRLREKWIWGKIDGP